tara:strand:- start:147 stop:710 length:564 start_codon:yes stop_codon:yes gene_type:complete
MVTPKKVKKKIVVRKKAAPKKVKKKVVVRKKAAPKKAVNKKVAAKIKAELPKRKTLATIRKAKNAKLQKRANKINSNLAIRITGNKTTKSDLLKYDAKSKRYKKGLELTKNMPKPKNIFGNTSVSGSRKQLAEALKKDDAKKKIRNAKEKAAILKSRKPVKPKSATQTAAEKKRSKEKAAIKKYKKK